MSSDKQREAIQAIDEMLKHLKKPRSIETKDIIEFYKAIEEKYDDNIQEIERIIFDEIEDEEKFDKLKKISKLLNINMF